MKQLIALILILLLAAGNLSFANNISNIRCNPTSPILVTFNSHVYINFDYSTEEESGVYIFIKPFTNGDITPNSFASGSPLYNTGDGNGLNNFTVTEGEVTVDQLQIQMYNGNMELLFELYYPVEFMFSDMSISNITFAPAQKNLFLNNEQVHISFNYNTQENGDVYIFMKPYTNGSPTPNGIFSGSPLYENGSGSGVSNFTVTEGEVTVDEIQVQMYNSSMNELLAECYVPVNFIFSSLAISDINFTPGTPSVKFHDNVFITFDYVSQEQGGIFIFMQPYTDGNPTPNFEMSGSPLYGQGSGSGVNNFTVLNGAVVVDQVLVQIKSSDLSEILQEFFVPANFIFSDFAITNIDFHPSSPAYFPFDQHAKVYFDYTANDGDEIYIFMEPFTNGELTPNFLAGGSPPYPSGEGSGMCNFTVTEGDINVDHLHFRMMKGDMSEALLEFFMPVNYTFGSQVTGIDENFILDIPDEYNLEQNYPNPFNPSTVIGYKIPSDIGNQASEVNLIIYDILGKEITTLVKKEQRPGNYQVTFNADGLPSGVYFYQLRVGDFVSTKKMILLR